MAQLPIAVQLYTIRDATQSDFAAAMKRVAEIGYTGVELAGYGNLKTASEVRKVLDDTGLQAAGMHVVIEQMEQDMTQVLDDAETLGCRMLVCPYWPESRRTMWDWVAGELSIAAAAAHQRGITFAYHNHAFEFEPVGSERGMDILWNTASDLVKSELDAYWVKAGGDDPVSYIRRIAHRIVAVHLKDMTDTTPPKFANVGSGILDIPAIVQASIEAGAQWGIVEQDSCYDQDPMDAIRVSFENLKQMGLA